MALIRRFVNLIIGTLVRQRTRVIADRSANVSWTQLWATRGGVVYIGEGSIVHCRIAFDAPGGVVRIGNACFIGASRLVCHSEINIGDDVIISWGVTIVDHDSHALDWNGRARDVSDWRHGRKNWDDVTIRPVYIEDKVWIGFGATILKGVRLGKCSVIGAGSVVTKDVPPFSVVAGNPARVVRTLGSSLASINCPSV